MAARTRVAVYAGVFDPPTNGHLEIISRAANLFDEVVVAVYRSPNKQTLFGADERLALVRESVAEERIHNVRVREYDDLTVRVAHEEGAITLVRGIRAVSDFDYEFNMSHMNRNLAPDVETTAILASAEYAFLSSTLVREVAKLGEDVRKWVPRVVAERLRERFRGGRGRAGATPPDSEAGPDLMGGFRGQDDPVR